MSALSVRLTALAALLIPPLSADAQGGQRAPGDTAGVAITFLANEGVLLSSATRKVLIDALFLKYDRGFAIPAESTQLALHSAQAPFDGVDLALVTHHHGDHFHPAPMVAHLRASPRTWLFAAQQVADSMHRRVAASPSVRARVRAVTSIPGTRRREVVNGVTFEVLGLRHHDIDHHGYIVEIGGRRVLHVGDTDDGAKSLPSFRLDTARIDVALLPAWMGTQRGGREMIDRWIKPKQVMFFHLGDREREFRDVEVRLKAAFPGAVVLWSSLEEHRR